MLNDLLTIIRTDSSNADFQALVGALDQDLTARNGELQRTYNKYNKIDSISTAVVAYHSGMPVGCGCFKLFQDHSVEIKRMFVLPQYRGRGISVKILRELETWAIEKGFTSAVLETGIKQFEAIALYRKMGYGQIENYGQYIGNTNSVCMRKEFSIYVE